MAEPLTLTICLEYKQLRTCVNKCTDGSNYTTEVSQELSVYLHYSFIKYLWKASTFWQSSRHYGNSKTIDKVPALMEKKKQ